MSNVNWNKVKSVTETVLGEEGRAVYIMPVVYSLAIVLVTTFIDNQYSDMIEDSISFTIALSMIIPTILIIEKFVGSSRLQHIITLPASNIDKYAAMILAIALKSVIWLAVMLVTDIVFLLIISHIIYGTGYSSVLGLIFDTKYIRFILPMMYIASLVGWLKIAYRTGVTNRYVEYVLAVISSVLYLLILPVMSDYGYTAVVLALNVYSILIIILAVVRSYNNFKIIRDKQ